MGWRVRFMVTSWLALPWLATAIHAEDSPLVLAVNRPPVDANAIPSARELQARGVRIGHIDIQVDDIFEGGMQLAAPYRIANGLHISTRERTVLQQLLFHGGEVYRPRLIAETERLLRGQRYFNEATIEVSTYHPEDNTVDLVVRVHDVWTLSPGISFGRKGGENSTGMEFEDTNFLGLGKEISLGRSGDVDRTAWRLAYTDPNLLGSWWALSGAYSSASDGAESALALQRPFYALDTRWSANMAVSDITSAVHRYSLGHSGAELNLQKQSFEFGGGVSAGLRNGWAKRYLAGVRYESRRFAQHPHAPDVLLPEDRVLAYPWIGFEVLEENYVSTHNLDQIGRTEDLYLGRRAKIAAGFASSALGSTQDAVMLEGTLQAGADLGEKGYMTHLLAFDGRLENGALTNAMLELNSRYYRRHSQQRVSFASLTGTLSSRLDPESQLLLGGDNGLRGYPLRYQAGSASALLTLEERFYTHWQPLKLFNVGAAVFADAGRTWGRDAFAAPPAGWLTDVGVGLRLGGARSGLGNVLHVDLAFPLDRGNDIDGIQLLVETRKSF